MSQLFELVIKASGEVRDANGELVEQVPIEQTVTVTEEQARALLEASEEQ